MEVQKATCILGSSNNIPDQSKEQHGFSWPQFPQGRCLLPFLFRMTKGHCPFVPGLTRHCITMDSEMAASLHHSTLKETQDVTAEVAANPHPPRSHHRTPLGPQVSPHPGCPNGPLCSWHVPQGSPTSDLDMELRVSSAPPSASSSTTILNWRRSLPSRLTPSL